MKELNIESLLKDWLSPQDMKGLDELVKYLEQLGEKAKKIKTVDDAYDFATELGMKCTREEFKEGADTLEYIGDQIKKEADRAEKEAEKEFNDAVALYMTAENRLKAAQAEYAKYSKDLEAEFEQNRKLAPEYVQKASKKLEDDAKKFYEDVQKFFDSKDVKGFMDFSQNIENLGKRLSKAKNTKDVYEIAKELGLECTWEEFKEGAKSLGIYEK